MGWREGWREGWRVSDEERGGEGTLAANRVGDHTTGRHIAEGVLLSYKKLQLRDHQEAKGVGGGCPRVMHGRCRVLIAGGGGGSHTDTEGVGVEPGRGLALESRR